MVWEGRCREASPYPDHPDSALGGVIDTRSRGDPIKLPRTRLVPFVRVGFRPDVSAGFRLGAVNESLGRREAQTDLLVDVGRVGRLDEARVAEDDARPVDEVLAGAAQLVDVVIGDRHVAGRDDIGFVSSAARDLPVRQSHAPGHVFDLVSVIRQLFDRQRNKFVVLRDGEDLKATGRISPFFLNSSGSDGFSMRSISPV